MPLALSPAIPSPILHGVWRPLILLPRDLCEWTTVAEREAMLAHELAHLARRDHVTKLLPLALNAIFFFHPLVRYACRQFCLERELACDDHAIHHGADAATYAESLLKAAEHSLSQAAGFALHQPAFFSSKQTLERRIEMIFDTNRVRVAARQGRTLWLAAVLIAATAWLLIPARSAQTGRAQSREAATGQLLQELVDTKSYGSLLAVALHNPQPEVREQAVQRLLDLTDKNGTATLLRLFEQSRDQAVRERVIREFGRRNMVEQIEQLIKRVDNSALLKQAEEQLSLLIARHDNDADTRRLAQASANTTSRWIELQTKESITGAVNETLNQAWQEAPPPPPPSPREYEAQQQALQTVVRELVEAQLRRDTTALEQVLTEDYFGTGPFGEVSNKAQQIAQVKGQAANYKRFEMDDFRANLEGNMAVASFLGTVYAQTPGQSQESATQFRYTITFTRRGEQWRIAAAHMSARY